MVCCVFQVINYVNNYRPRKSTRAFVSRLELAINYIRCCKTFFFVLSISDDGLIDFNKYYLELMIFKKLNNQILLRPFYNLKSTLHNLLKYLCLYDT
jgi:hypothetical protein